MDHGRFVRAAGSRVIAIDAGQGGLARMRYASGWAPVLVRIANAAFGGTDV